MSFPKRTNQSSAAYGAEEPVDPLPVLVPEPIPLLAVPVLPE
jgi:hypothetical protein